MSIQFATCNRKSALEFIQKVNPSKSITDTEGSAKKLLDFVEKDIVRIQDPMMYGNKIQVVPGKKWVEDANMRNKIIEACKIFHE
jgi:CRISPR/Cas system-associated exonuclease Cas4 (RecB family)